MWDGPERGYRVLRGGSWNNNDNNNRCANRNNNNPNNNWNNNGFRLARKSAAAGARVSSGTREACMARLKARSRAPGVPGDKYSRSGRAAGSGFANAAWRGYGIAEALNRGDAERMEARNPDFRLSFCFPRFRGSGRWQQTA